MHFVWLTTTVVLFISLFDNGNVKGNNLEIQVTRKLQEMIDLKERLESLGINMSSFLNNNNHTKLNSMVQEFEQEKVYRINLKKKIEYMEKAYGQQLEDLATTIKNIDRHIENRLLAKTNATEVSFGSKLEETVSTIEQKFKGSMSKLNQTLGNLYEQINQWRVLKPVNGGWTAWGSWTSCTSSCGKGINNRVRTCTNPAPANGGNYCDGVGMEYNECQISSCKVNGGWTAWGSWTSCTSSCGKGINNRVRTCTNPAPANGGNYCDGVGMEYNECQISSCKVNGGWTAWGSWTSCTSSCGKGINNRVRTCTNPAPANGGNYCDGVGMEYNECQISSCKAMPYCERGWEEYQGSCYFFVHKNEDSLSWKDAKEFCDRSNSHLLRIDNQMEFEFIKNVLWELHDKQLQEGITPLSGYWTGGNDIRNEREWVWSPRDVKMRFTVWSQGEPNDKDGVEDCGELSRYKDFKMNDLNCLRDQYFICEKLLLR